MQQQLPSQNTLSLSPNKMMAGRPNLGGCSTPLNNGNLDFSTLSKMSQKGQKPISKEDDGYMEENEDDDDEETFAEKEDNDTSYKIGGLATSKNILQMGSSTVDIINSSDQKESRPTIIQSSLSRLAMPLPLVAAGHSMAPDMQFGWKPQADKEIPPIPLCFGLVHYNLEQFNYPKVLYVGTRFKNSYKMHESFANKALKLPIPNDEGESQQVQTYPFTFPKFYDSNNFTYEEAFNYFVESLEFDSSIHDQDLNFQVPQTQVNGKRGDQNSMLSALSYKDEREEYTFDSNFESGNLDFAGKIQENDYDLLMRLDSNSRSHQQWFYFSIDCQNICKRSTKGETIKLTIMNFTKPNSLYNQGMRPVAWSKMKCTKEGVGWHRVGQNINYKISKLCRQNFNGGGYNRTWYQMSFEYTFEYDQDKIWFAYAIPYSFTMLTNFIKAVEDIQRQPENLKQSLIFKKEIIGKSLSGVEIPILTITDFSEKNTKLKKTIVMVGRLHPGETHSSWLIHGFIRFLLSEAPKAKELRKRIVFKIVPMLNPDGVIVGNYRCTLTGCDMNRNFGGDQVAQRLNPETLLFKKMAKQQNRTALFFDVHSHSSKKSIFIYGPYFPLHSEHYLKIRVMPRLLAEKTTMFRYYSCRFRNEKHKINCSRLTIFRECNLPHCYTIETSIMGFLSKERQNVSFGIPSLQYFGEKFGETLLEWFQILEIHQREKIKKAIMMSKQRKTRKRTIIDIIGEEDYQEFREVIDDQLNQQDKEDQLQGGSPDPLSKKKSKKSQNRKKSTKVTRRKTLVINANQAGAGASSTEAEQLIALQAQMGILRSQTQPEINTSVTRVMDIRFDSMSSPKKSALDNVQVSNIAIESEKKGSQRKKDKNANSSEDMEEDDDDDSNGNDHQPDGNQTLKPMLHHKSNNDSSKTGSKEQAQTNKGFNVPKLAGFQYLEGPEFLQRAAKELKEKFQVGYRNQGGGFGAANLNGDIMLSNSDLGKFNVLDDDELFIQEDQMMTQNGGDQPLRRLEDIVGEIRKDMIKAHANGSGGNSGDITEQQQTLYDEKDLDSQRSEGRDQVNDLDADYDLQMEKMQHCLVSYLENVEDLQGNSSGSAATAVARMARQVIPPPVVQPQVIKKEPSNIMIKEKRPAVIPQAEIVVTQVQQKISPVRIQKSVPIPVFKQDLIVPQKKEIVFQLKKPPITSFPPEKPKTAHNPQRPSIHNFPPPLPQHGNTFSQQSPQQPIYMHHHRGGALASSSPSHVPKVPLDAKDLSFTLMNRTSQEFFELLNQFVPTKVVQPSQQYQHSYTHQQLRANTSIVQKQGPIQAYSSVKQSSGQNKSILHHMQNQHQMNSHIQNIDHTATATLQNTLTTSRNQPQGLNKGGSPIIVSGGPMSNNNVGSSQGAQSYKRPGGVAPIVIASPNADVFATRNMSDVEDYRQGKGGENISNLVIYNRNHVLQGDNFAFNNPQAYQQATLNNNLNGHDMLTLKSEYESPQKRRLMEAKANFMQVKSGTNIGMKRHKTERKKNVLLLVDGRGVVQQSFQETKNNSATKNSMVFTKQNQHHQSGVIMANPVGSQHQKAALQLLSEGFQPHSQFRNPQQQVRERLITGEFNASIHSKRGKQILRPQSSIRPQVEKLSSKGGRVTSDLIIQDKVTLITDQLKGMQADAYEIMAGSAAKQNRRFTHSRHSSNSYQVQNQGMPDYSMRIQSMNFKNSWQQSPQVQGVASNSQNQYASPLKVSTNQQVKAFGLSEEQVKNKNLSPIKVIMGMKGLTNFNINSNGLIVIPETNNEALRMVQNSMSQIKGTSKPAKAEPPLNFYLQEDDQDEFENNLIDSSRYYHEHLDNYFDESSTSGLNIQLQELGKQTISPNQRNKTQSQSQNQHPQHHHHRKLKPSHYYITDDQQYIGPPQQQPHSSLEGFESSDTSRVSLGLGLSSIDVNINRRELAPSGSKQMLANIKMTQDQEESMSQAYNPLPMKNQLLIDMFRQANSHSSVRVQSKVGKVLPTRQASETKTNLKRPSQMINASHILEDVSLLQDSGSQVDQQQQQSLTNLRIGQAGPIVSIVYESRAKQALANQISPDKRARQQQAAYNPGGSQQQPNSLRHVVVPHNATS